MKSKSDLIKEYLPCTCGEMYLSRNMVAPDCPQHAFGIEELIDEYAKEISIGFAEWLGGEGYQNYDGKDRWIAVHNNNHVYSTKELYELFLSTPPPNNTK